jgi:glycosyltransferase involved in cell wall biosynthesis
MKAGISVLFISYDGMTDPLGQSQVIPYLIGLRTSGYKVHLISCEKEQMYASDKDRIQNMLKEVDIFWHPVNYTKKPPLFSTVWDIIKIYRKAKFIHKKYSYSLVHCRSYIPAFVSQRLKKKKGVKFLFDIRGFWADERVEGNIWNLKNPLFNLVYKFLKFKERGFFNDADHIVTLTESSKHYIQKHYKYPRSITTIPCAADLDLFQNRPEHIKHEFRTKLGLKDEYVLLYLGSVGTWYLLEEMLDFFVVLKSNKPSAKFLFITPDSPATIINLGLEKGLVKEDFRIVKSARNEVPNYISIANSSIFFIKECFSKMASSPTKHGELLSCGIPIVCNDIGDLKKIIDYKGAGYLVDSFNEASYQEAIDRLDSMNGIKEGPKTAKQFYDLTMGQEKYISIYNDLLS